MFVSFPSACPEPVLANASCFRELRPPSKNKTVALVRSHWHSFPTEGQFHISPFHLRVVVTELEEKRISSFLSALSLCLSRACLGKMMAVLVVAIKWCKRCVFSYLDLVHDVLRPHLSPLVAFPDLRFKSPLRLFVPSVSWQIYDNSPRACLGKLSSHLHTRESIGRKTHHVLRQNGPFFEVSLCLSRACLGKKSIFKFKWLKKTRFYSPARVTLSRRIPCPLANHHCRPRAVRPPDHHPERASW